MSVSAHRSRAFSAVEEAAELGGGSWRSSTGGCCCARPKGQQGTRIKDGGIQSVEYTVPFHCRVRSPRAAGKTVILRHGCKLKFPRGVQDRMLVSQEFRRGLRVATCINGSIGDPRL